MNEQELQLIQYAILGYIGYAASQKQQITVDDAAKQVAQIYQDQPEALAQIAQNQQLVKAGVEIVQQTEPEKMEQLASPEGIQQLMSSTEEASPAVQSAKSGAKLSYIKQLKGNCPDGYEMIYMKAGGRVCPVCQKKKAEQAKAKKAEEGTKMSGVSKAMAGIKAELMKCGKKIKKNEQPSGPIEKKKSPDEKAMKRDSLEINSQKYPEDTLDKEEKGKWVKNYELPKGAKPYNNGKNRNMTWIPNRKKY